MAIVPTAEVIVKTPSCFIPNDQEPKGTHSHLRASSFSVWVPTGIYMAGCENGAFHQFAPWVIRNFSLYFTWVFPWAPLVLDVGDRLGNFCLLIKLRDPVISLTLANSPVWKRESLNVLAGPHGVFSHGRPESGHIRTSKSLPGLCRSKRSPSPLHSAPPCLEPGVRQPSHSPRSREGWTKLGVGSFKIHLQIFFKPLWYVSYWSKQLGR